MSDNNYQGRSSAIGGEFEEHCRGVLRRGGWDVLVAVPSEVAGVRVDIVALNRHGRQVNFECKAASAESTRRGGLNRTDDVKKATADAFFLQFEPYPVPYVVLTNQMPLTTMPALMIEIVIEHGLWHAAVDMNTNEGVEQLRAMYEDEELQR